VQKPFDGKDTANNHINKVGTLRANHEKESFNSSLLNGLNRPDASKYLSELSKTTNQKIAT
jgi:hypothetical protein